MPKLCVSTSGGKTSGKMANDLKKTRSGDYEMVFIFANTGQENKQTLDFLHRCDDEWNLGLVWVEAVIHNAAVASTHKIVDYESASREGEPFEAMIEKYGIPNKAYPHCTRELKLNPIRSYLNSIGWTKGTFFSAVGIRGDEPQRLREDAKEAFIVYPLAQRDTLFEKAEFSDLFATKQMINDWWEEQSFNLELAEYEGNCRTCWKKSTPKLIRIAQETPESFEFFDRMEREHGLSGYNEDGTPRKFFRNHMSTQSLLRLAQLGTVSPILDDPDMFGGCSESCEAFA